MEMWRNSTNFPSVCCYVTPQTILSIVCRVVLCIIAVYNVYIKYYNYYCIFALTAWLKDPIRLVSFCV
jgi:hypothetical protein